MLTAAASIRSLSMGSPKRARVDGPGEVDQPVDEAIEKAKRKLLKLLSTG